MRGTILSRPLVALGLALAVVGLGHTQTVTQLAFWDFNTESFSATSGVNASSALIRQEVPLKLENSCASE